MSDEQIFISIASYRDPETQWTIRSALERARNPSRLVFGICWQIDPDSDQHLFEHLPKARFPGQFRQIVMPHREAGGPAYARALIQDQLYAGERFYLQIDAHTMFRADFDQDLIQEWRAASAVWPKPILTSYPHGYDGFGSESQRSADAVFVTDPGPIRLEPLGFDANDGRLRIVGRPLAVASGGPVRHHFWAAGFSFADGAVVDDCRYDRRLFGIFFGEESVMAARLYTSGYDFVVPRKAVLLTKWSRAYRPTFRDVPSTPDRERRTRIGQYRLSLVLGCAPSPVSSDEHAEACAEIDSYGLGGTRTLNDYESDAGVRFATRTVVGRSPPPPRPDQIIALHLGLAFS